MWFRCLLFASLSLASVISLTAQQTPQGTPPHPLAPSSSAEDISVKNDIQYGTAGGQKLLLDVYEPAGQSNKLRAAVVLIHGGGWSSFDKSTMTRMGQFLARQGFVAFSVDYRLFHDGQNRWPAQLDDVQMAVRWIRAHAATYNIDPDHIGAFGHSAGAQLAALLGMEDTRDNSDPALAKYSSRVQAVVDVSGPADFFLRDHDPDGDADLANFFGGDSTKAAEAWRSASPVDQVAKSDAPFLIVHGTHDDAVPIAQAQELYDKLQQANVPVTFLKIDDGHTFTSPEARRQLAMESLAFFNRYLVSP
jgi:acetyl esterase/lipase